MTEKKGWLSRLTSGLKKTSHRLSDGIHATLTHRKLDQETLNELEDFLISCDLGVEPSQHLIKKISQKRYNQTITAEEVHHLFAEEIENQLQPYSEVFSIDKTHKPYVITVVGVNGSGKTTTIGKLASKWTQDRYKVAVIAGDTFRAAATEQLELWAKKSDVFVYKASQGADAAGLIFDSYQQAKENKTDILIIDTAGRLHNKTTLMDELKKIDRVIKKVDPSAPHLTLIVLDATSGQNTLSQVEAFHKATPLSGLVLTKLDGTAKGGILIALTQKFSLPIYAVGVGEGIDDLYSFSPKDFAESLMNVTLTKMKE